MNLEIFDSMMNLEDTVNSNVSSTKIASDLKVGGAGRAGLLGYK